MAVQTIDRPTQEAPEADYWPPPQGQFTYADYLRQPDNGFRYEIIKGELYMSPAPRPRHQRVLVALLKAVLQYIDEHHGEVLIAPIDLILPGLATPVQPDLLYLNQDQIDMVKETYVEGAPQLIVEVLSPGNSDYDRQTKFNVYAEAGVAEYWLIDPDARTVEVFALRGRAYALAGKFEADDTLRSEVLAEFQVSVDQICGG